MNSIDKPKIKVDKIDNLNYSHTSISSKDTFRVFCNSENSIYTLKFPEMSSIVFKKEK